MMMMMMMMMVVMMGVVVVMMMMVMMMMNLCNSLSMWILKCVLYHCTGDLTRLLMSASKVYHL